MFYFKTCLTTLIPILFIKQLKKTELAKMYYELKSQQNFPKVMIFVVHDTIFTKYF